MDLKQPVHGTNRLPYWTYLPTSSTSAQCRKETAGQETWQGGWAGKAIWNARAGKIARWKSSVAYGTDVHTYVLVSYVRPCRKL